MCSTRLLRTGSAAGQGWELRLTAGTFQRSQVCKIEAEVFSASEQWQQEARRQGWS